MIQGVGAKTVQIVRQATTTQDQIKLLQPYLFLDIFSRKIVGWQAYAEESAQHASDMIKDICQREEILPGQVTLH
ncbi:hypothetical protein Rin_00010490, partial [Candidatus Regiella insecticola 5.15]